MTTAGAPRRRRGRPAAGEADGGPSARERILTAARTEFAARGYDKASIRGIARRADVDPALVHHYFGPKEQVFASSLRDAVQPALDIPDVLSAGAPEEAGERLTRHLFGVWENTFTREPLLAVIRSAVNNETAASIFRATVVRQLLKRVAPQLTGTDAELRAELAVAQLVGTAMLRYIIKVEPLASADPEDLIRRLAPVVQQHLADG
ncbi:HTH-type transcriptional regulator BetI [Streptomyces sp. RB5]|uniref:HTH-type transcriptional regulator BetI n=1 Tax=Streptomyces smaragdinus TaxID=2585196 RepID=A0A7K0CV23_9ACTN|nr:TetR family transcriptional regulator [Streptomyces smaragdinus]MQY16514.1 HTH-type transcriptional regulator BetI [Streptomyces smaragdinus]